MGVLPGPFLRPAEPAVRKVLEQIVPTARPANAVVPAPRFDAVSPATDEAALPAALPGAASIRR
jgi:hypothetical protein